MFQIITNYALEQKTEKGEPSGVFKMDKTATMNAVKSVIKQAKHVEGKDLDTYAQQYFPRTWEHFDVNKEGKLDVLDMPAFMKYVCSDQGLDLDSMSIWKIG